MCKLRSFSRFRNVQISKFGIHRNLNQNWLKKRIVKATKSVYHKLATVESSCFSQRLRHLLELLRNWWPRDSILRCTRRRPEQVPIFVFPLVAITKAFSTIAIWNLFHNTTQEWKSKRVQFNNLMYTWVYPTVLTEYPASRVGFKQLRILQQQKLLDFLDRFPDAARLSCSFELSS